MSVLRNITSYLCCCSGCGPKLDDDGRNSQGHGGPAIPAQAHTTGTLARAKPESAVDGGDSERTAPPLSRETVVRNGNPTPVGSAKREIPVNAPRLPVPPMQDSKLAETPAEDTLTPPPAQTNHRSDLLESPDLSQSPEPPGATSYQRDGKEMRKLLSLLKEHAALGALANSLDREGVPRCRVDARCKTLEDLHRWSKSEGSWKRVRFLILTGPPGQGKTTLMQTLADGLLEFESKGDYIAVVSFFFVESHPDQGHPRCLVATLAHQMAEQCASIRPFIADAVADRGSIFSMALKYQVENLLIKPVECAAQTHGISLPCAILVVDGLHECGPIKPSHGVGGQTAQATRSLVVQLLHSLAASGLFRVAISSQPGQHHASTSRVAARVAKTGQWGGRWSSERLGACDRSK
ncbi:hypothetical protein FA13DRAFT_1319049 [Coprinellus micaceus]|uniref:NACHT domain-containing protein n=1 Tax=Coprinellus micaceus TaxID=71717 RepID=A0A4Y7SRF8_COPMI|nr:hypothetical protein FA13DRAFT_1319049 [Coprinellus micaceus]